MSETLSKSVDLAHHDEDGYWLEWYDGVSYVDQSVQSWLTREEAVAAWRTGGFSWKTTKPWEAGWRPVGELDTTGLDRSSP